MVVLQYVTCILRYVQKFFFDGENITLLLLQSAHQYGTLEIKMVLPLVPNFNDVLRMGVKYQLSVM
jgi:hypothetical protein